MGRIIQIHNVSNWGNVFFLSNLDYMFDELGQVLYKQYRKVSDDEHV
jgi:hypothetical protein